MVILTSLLCIAFLAVFNLLTSNARESETTQATQQPRLSDSPRPSPTAARKRILSPKPDQTAVRSEPPPYIPTLEPGNIGSIVPGVPALAPGSIQVHFINVGQGDSILIMAPGEVAVLIDGGYAGMGTVEYLQAVGVERITLMVATHPHADHIGGLVDVLRSMPVDEVVTNGRSYTTQVYEQFLDAIADAKAKYREVRRGETLTAGELSFQVLNPESPNADSDVNDSSIVLRLVHGPTSFLFTGDAESSAERKMVSTGQLLQATILKVGHHGSKTSSTPEFLKVVQPEVAIYSAGVDNPYGHPHQSSLDALARVGAKVYGTDVSGTVVVTADRSGYRVFTQKPTDTRGPPTRQVRPTKTPRPLPSATTRPTRTSAPSRKSATPRSRVTVTATATVDAQVGASELPLELVSLTSPARRNSNATLTIQTLPGAQCAITVLYKSGPSRAAGLVPKVADAEGRVSWTWMVGGNTTPGTWKILVTSSVNGMSREIAIPFQVKR